MGCRGTSSRLSRVGVALAVVLALSGLAALAAPAAVSPEPAGERIVRIVLKGNVRIPAHRILGQMHLREGSLYTPPAVDEDLKRIYGLGEFDNVIIRPEKEPAGLVLVVEVKERLVLERVEFVGNRQFSAKDLEAAAGLKAGSPLDPQKIFAGARSIERKYRDAGFYFVHVALDEPAVTKDRAARYTITEGPRVRISKIAFSGNASIPTRELEKQTESRAYAPVLAAGTFDENQLNRDLAAIRNYYIGQGFLDVRVDRRPEFSEDKTRVKIQVLIEEGPRYRVRSLALQGVKRFASSYLEKLMELAPGVPYTADRVRHDLEVIRGEYGEIGYIDAVPHPETQFTNERGMVDVVVKVDEGSAVRIGEIRVEGNRLTEDKVVRRDLGVFPEEPVNTKLVDKARRRLEGTGLFRPGSVQITTIPTKDPDVADLLVRVEEAETTNLILGAGISSNSGVVGNLSFVQRNFDLTAWPKSAQDFWRGEAFRGAGQLFQIVLEPGTQLQRYRVDFQDPHVADSDYSLSTSLFYFTRNRNTYDEKRVGGNVGVGKDLGHNLQAFVNLRLEAININHIDADAPQDVFDVKGSSLLTSVEVGLVKDTTDSLLFPTEGYRLSASVEQAGALGGSYAFTKITLDGRRYWTITRDVLDRRSVLALHGRIGDILGDAPIFERFYAGGQGSLRGFRYRGVGPRSGDTELGGNFLALASAEYSFPIFEKSLTGVFFVDSGTVEKQISLSTWRIAAGFGIRFTVPFFGPIPFALDFGFPLVKGVGDRTEVFSFSIGTSF
jgi:outer membrane protein insertion porin family